MKFLEFTLGIFPKEKEHKTVQPVKEAVENTAQVFSAYLTGGNCCRSLI